MKRSNDRTRTTCLAIALSLISFSCLIAADGDASELSRLNVQGTELHYEDSGSGIPIVLVHGGLADYRELAPLAQALPDRYRTVLYSRRHSFPNDNPPPRADAHMAREVADIAGLIEALDIAPAHVAGVSYGAFIALMLAVDRAELVRSVIAPEPPLLHWLRDIDGGPPVYDDFQAQVMEPSRAAFAANEPERGLRVAMDYFVGPAGSTSSRPTCARCCSAMSRTGTRSRALRMPFPRYRAKRSPRWKRRF